MSVAESAGPLLAGLVSAAFATLVAKQYAARRKPHQLAWGLGLGAYAAASLIEAFVATSGWSIPLYRVYFPLAAGLVGLLGAGTVYLLGKPRVANAFAALVGALILVAALGQLAVPLDVATPVTVDGETRPLGDWGTDLASKAVPLPNPARAAFIVLNVAGGVALVGGALWSFWQSRAWGVLLIGVGALVPFMGGTFSSLGIAEARLVAQLVGVAVMFAGYLAGTAFAREPRAPADAGAATVQQQ